MNNIQKSNADTVFTKFYKQRVLGKTSWFLREVKTKTFLLFIKIRFLSTTNSALIGETHRDLKTN